MKWTEAIAKIDKPTLSNREASGLVSFARQVVNVFGRQTHLDPFDWYAWTLSVFGWTKPGDKFAVNTAHQLAAFPRAAELRAAIAKLGAQLDEAKIPFRLVVDPRGNDRSFRALAKDAWAVMQRGAEPAEVETAPADVALVPATPRKRGRAALIARMADPDHARWFLYAENKDGTWITAEAADETKARASFEQFAALDDVAYAAFWDTSKKILKPAQEYAGAIDVAPDRDARRVGVSAAGGLVLLALLAFAATRERKR